MKSSVCVVVLMTVLLVACGGSSKVSRSNPGYYERRTLAIGRLPNGQGFGIWARRYRFRGRDYVQLIASTAPVAPSTAKVREEFDGGEYGISQENTNDLTAPVALGGIVACAKHPVVLLYGLVHEQFGVAVLRFHRYHRPFNRVALPSAFGVNAALGYGFLTANATLQIRSPTGALFYSEEYPGPPSSVQCAGGTQSVHYFSAEK